MNDSVLSIWYEIVLLSFCIYVSAVIFLLEEIRKKKNQRLKQKRNRKVARFFVKLLPLFGD